MRWSDAVAADGSDGNDGGRQRHSTARHGAGGVLADRHHNMCPHLLSTGPHDAAS